MNHSEQYITIFPHCDTSSIIGKQALDTLKSKQIANHISLILILPFTEAMSHLLL